MSGVAFDLRIKNEHLRDLYAKCVKHTELLSDSERTLEGFVVGFRLYERMAKALGRELTIEDVSRFDLGD